MNKYGLMCLCVFMGLCTEVRDSGIHLFSKYLLSTYYVPGVIGDWEYCCIPMGLAS